MNHNELVSKVNEMRDVINKQSVDIRQMNNIIIKMKFVLGYEQKKHNFDIFFDTLEKEGIDIQEALKKNPAMFNSGLDALRRM